MDNMGIGGTELNAVRVAEHLDRDRFEISVACLRDDGPLLARYEAAGIQVDRYPIHSLVGPSSVIQGARFRSFLARSGVDVVHAHDRYTNAFAVPWARLARVPRVIASKRWGTISRSHRIANILAYRVAHGVLANSSRVARSLSIEDGVSPRRVVTIPNFVDNDAFIAPSNAWRVQMRRALDIPADSLIIGIVANLRAVKDHATLIRAFSAVASERQSVILVLAGSGGEESALRALANQLGVAGRIRFAGTLSNTPNIHHLFDFSVLTSRSEGFPNSLIEAMAAGNAVVATDVGGVADAVIDGITGILVPAGHADELSLAMRRVLDNEPLREAMGVHGRRRALDEFSTSSVIPLFESLYSGDVGL